MAADPMDVFEQLYGLLGQKRALLGRSAPPLPVNQLATLKDKHSKLFAKLAACKEWDGVAAELQLVHTALWEEPEAEAEVTLSKLQKLFDMGAFNKYVTEWLSLGWFPVPGTKMPLPLAGVLQVFCGWQSTLRRWCGVPRYTAQMRVLLAFNSAEAWLWLLVVSLCLRELPAALVTAVFAALCAVHEVLESAFTAAVRPWHSDDLPQRRRHIEQLAESVQVARGMAAAGGSAAGLARAMAGRLEQTLARAAAVLSGIVGQPV